MRKFYRDAPLKTYSPLSRTPKLTHVPAALTLLITGRMLLPAPAPQACQTFKGPLCVHGSHRPLTILLAGGEAAWLLTPTYNDRPIHSATFPASHTIFFFLSLTSPHSSVSVCQNFIGGKKKITS